MARSQWHKLYTSTVAAPPERLFELGVRVTYLASALPLTDTSAPDCDFAVPIH
jgi:hypothetical protein